MDELRVTTVVAQILKVFLDDLAEPRFGMDLMRATGLPSGTVYPTMARLLRTGVVISEMEDIDPAAAGRPARRYYRLDPSQAARAHCEVVALAEKLQPRGVSAPVGRLRPATNGGNA